MNQDALDTNLLNSFKAFAGSHFMLNGLNTVQSDILLKKNQEAFQNLQICLRLYKHAIRSSNDQFISIQEEVGFVNQYLKMEKIRFGDAGIPAELSFRGSNELTIPSFVLQSFIENALLINREIHESRLSLSAAFSNGKLKVKMGVSGEYDQQYHPKVESKTRLAEERLELLNSQAETNHKVVWGSAVFCELQLEVIN